MQHRYAPKRARSRLNSSGRTSPLRALYQGQPSQSPAETRDRIRLFGLGFLILMSCIIVRLGYWQIVKGAELSAQAESQYERSVVYQGQRGSILFSDGSPLVTNERVYRLFALPHLIPAEQRPALAAQLAPLLLSDNPSASASAVMTLTEELTAKLNKPNSKWVSLAQPLSEELKDEISQLQLENVGFDAYTRRMYPEGSMAAHLTGFVGKTADGDDIGYFGLEGALDAELKPQKKSKLVLTDALGYALFAGDGESQSLDGRTVTTTVRRDVQSVVERALKKGIAQYAAAGGEIIVMQPQTGAILGLAAAPSYDQRDFAEFPASSYKNPSLATNFEPGSTFKVMTVSVGIDTGSITPDTVCTTCAGPRQFGKYTIRTWNDEYHPNITMTDALAKSDNVAMIFAAERIGANTFLDYLHAFGIGEKIHIDLQEDTTTPLADSLGPVELATTSFGQGITTNSLQLIRAVNVIANGGVRIDPTILAEVDDPTSNAVLTVTGKNPQRVISAATAAQVTQMMVSSAQHGEAQWTDSKTHAVAGKTGTSQVAIKGGYDEDQTVASFIGFAPPTNPKFIMLVKLDAPQSSPWAAETAAPLWYHTADELYVLLGVPPDKTSAPAAGDKEDI